MRLFKVCLIILLVAFFAVSCSGTRATLVKKGTQQWAAASQSAKAFAPRAVSE